MIDLDQVFDPANRDAVVLEMSDAPGSEKAARTKGFPRNLGGLFVSVENTGMDDPGTKSRLERSRSTFESETRAL